MRKFVISLSVCLFFFGCGEKPDETQTDRKMRKYIELHHLLSQRRLEEALALSDTLVSDYPEMPEFYFVRGWIYDQKNDSLNKKEAFTKCRDLYDRRISEMDSWWDAVNRAFVTQVLYGMDAYHKEVDSLKKYRRKDYLDNPGCDMILDSANYEKMKDNLFQEEVEQIDNTL